MSEATKTAGRQIKLNEIGGVNLVTDIGVWDENVAYASNVRKIWVGKFWRSNAITSAGEEPGVSDKWDEILTDISQQKLVNQTTHGFSVGNIVQGSGSSFSLAKADASITLGFLMVSEVVDADNFIVAMSGYIEGLSGLIAGEYHFLSDSSAGTLTPTEPEISVLLFFAIFTNAGFLLPYRPVQLGFDLNRLETLTTKTLDYTVLTSDYLVLADGTSNTIDITLPTAIGLDGVQFIIKAINITFAVTIQTDGSETIDGASSISFISQYESHTLISDGTNWVEV